jgi:hypothetical protein
MKTILSIGYRHYVLPASANVSTIIKNLAGAVEAEEKYHDGKYYYVPKEGIEMNFKVVKPEFVLDGKRRSIPEKCGPESQGSKFELREEP